MATPIAEFKYGDIRLLGASLAGEETFIAVPEMNLAFDVGRAPREVVTIDHVFLTHGHMDHAAGVAYYCSQRVFIDTAPGTLYVPQGLVEPLRRLLRLWGDIDGYEPPANIHAAIPGTDIEVRRNLVVRPFKVNHACRRHDALGYAVVEVRQKLKEEFQGLEEPQLIALKRSGTPITRRVEMPLVTFCGDTAPGDFFAQDFVRNAKVLLLECTFFDPDHRERAQAGYHMHVSDLKEILPRLNNERIVITHVSHRTPLPEAQRILRQELGDVTNERVTFLMQHRRRKRPAPSPAAETPPSTSF